MIVTLKDGATVQIVASGNSGIPTIRADSIATGQRSGSDWANAPTKKRQSIYTGLLMLLKWPTTKRSFGNFSRCCKPSSG